MSEDSQRITLKTVQDILEAADLIDEVLTADERRLVFGRAADQSNIDSKNRYVSSSILDGNMENGQS